jgi:hypothetical protein
MLLLVVAITVWLGRDGYVDDTGGPSPSSTRSTTRR